MSYHLSQQNTFTGRLTPSMLGDVLRQAVHLSAGRRGAEARGLGSGWRRANDADRD